MTGRNVFDGVAHGALASFALDAVEHRGVKRPEAEFDVAHFAPQHGPQTRQFGFELGESLTVVLPDRQLHQLQVQVVQVPYQMQRMLQVSLFLFGPLRAAGWRCPCTRAGSCGVVPLRFRAER